MSGEPRLHVRPPPRSSARWDESAASFLRDADAAAAPVTASSYRDGSPAAALSQELAEMRYDGGISTISS